MPRFAQQMGKAGKPRDTCVLICTSLSRAAFRLISPFELPQPSAFFGLYPPVHERLDQFLQTGTL